MAPVDGKVSLSLCQMLESEKKAAAAVSWQELKPGILQNVALDALFGSRMRQGCLGTCDSIDAIDVSGSRLSRRAQTMRTARGCVDSMTGKVEKEQSE